MIYERIGFKKCSQCTYYKKDIKFVSCDSRRYTATRSFTCKQATSPAFAPQPQSITAVWLVLILPAHKGQKAESTWVAGYIPKYSAAAGSRIRTVTHPSTNRAQRRLTSLIETNALPLRQTATIDMGRKVAGCCAHLTQCRLGRDHLPTK